ncbi:MAG: hypothetical protein WAL63_09065 [Solirubrobacteraceae bacterium]
MRRRYVIASIVTAIILFLAISALLARAFSVGDAEQAAIASLVKAEARGDPAGVIALITGCAGDAACRARAARTTAALRHPGQVSIATVQPSSSFSLGSTLGTARVAWLAGSSLPRTQCVRVRHAGNVLEGFSVQLLELSPRIATDGACPRRF